jgi:hypothetical protein
MPDLVGLIIRCYQQEFSTNSYRIDAYSEWKVQSIRAEVLNGNIDFYACCRKIKEHYFGRENDWRTEDCPLTPYMDIRLTSDGVPDSYKIIRTKRNG